MGTLGAFSIARSRAVYVDSVSGADSGDGTVRLPVQTLGRALSLAAVNYATTIRLRAPASAPLGGGVAITGSRDLTLESWRDEAWHVVGAAVAVAVESTGLVTLRDGAFSGDLFGVRIGKNLGPVGTGRVVAEDCTATGTSLDNPSSGWASDWQFTSVDLLRCTGLGVKNDGFNWHGATGVAGVITQTDCIGDDCYDEGVSPHNDVVLNIVGGHYNRNGQSGVAAVGNAVCNISGGAEFRENARLVELYGGVTYLEAASGDINGMVTADHPVPGLFLDTTGVVTRTAYTSTGNTGADVLISA